MSDKNHSSLDTWTKCNLYTAPHTPSKIDVECVEQFNKCNESNLKIKTNKLDSNIRSRALKSLTVAAESMTSTPAADKAIPSSLAAHRNRTRRIAAK